MRNTSCLDDTFLFCSTDRAGGNLPPDPFFGLRKALAGKWNGKQVREGKGITAFLLMFTALAPGSSLIVCLNEWGTYPMFSPLCNSLSCIAFLENNDEVHEVFLPLVHSRDDE